MEIKYYHKSLTLHIRVRTRHRVRERDRANHSQKNRKRWVPIQEVVHELEVIETDEEQNEIDEAQK